MINTRKIVVTGAAGFIGSHLSRRLVAQGHDVHLIDDLSHGHLGNITHEGRVLGTFHQLDVRDVRVAEVFSDADAVFHLAAVSSLPMNQSNPRQAIDVNVSGTAHVLEMSRRRGVRRVIFASTSAIYENNTTFPCREDDPVSPTLIYSLSKQQAELLCRAMCRTYGMDVVVTRYFNVYGPQQDLRRKSPAFVGYVIRELLNGRSPVLHSNGTQRRDYVHVDDVIAMNLMLMDSPCAAGQTYNIASGHAWSVLEMYAMIAKAVGTNISPQFRPATRFWDAYPELFEPPYPIADSQLIEEVDKFTLGSNTKAQTDLGWIPRISIEEGLGRTVTEMRLHLHDVDNRQ